MAPKAKPRACSKCGQITNPPHNKATCTSTTPTSTPAPTPNDYEDLEKTSEEDDSKSEEADSQPEEKKADLTPEESKAEAEKAIEEKLDEKFVKDKNFVYILGVVKYELVWTDMKNMRSRPHAENKRKLKYYIGETDDISHRMYQHRSPTGTHTLSGAQVWLLAAIQVPNRACAEAYEARLTKDYKFPENLSTIREGVLKKHPELKKKDAINPLTSKTIAEVHLLDHVAECFKHRTSIEQYIVKREQFKMNMYMRLKVSKVQRLFRRHMPLVKWSRMLEKMSSQRVAAVIKEAIQEGQRTIVAMCNWVQLVDPMYSHLQRSQRVRDLCILAVANHPEDLTSVHMAMAWLGGKFQSVRKALRLLSK